MHISVCRSEGLAGGSYVGLNAVIPLFVTLLNMLTPKDVALEELGAFRNLTSEFGLILLLDELFELLVQALFDWLSTKLSDINIFRFKYLQDLFFESFDPIEGAQELLVVLEVLVELLHDR